MPAYDMLVPTREQWQTIRDTAKVPKGAAKVSIGDSIAAVHKSFTPDTLSKNVKDTEQLIKDLDTYITQTKAKYPAFEAEVKKVRKKALDHQKAMESILKARELYYPRYSATLEAYKQVKSGNGKPDKIASKIEELRGCIAAFSLIDPKWMAKQQDGAAVPPAVPDCSHPD